MTIQTSDVLHYLQYYALGHLFGWLVIRIWRATVKLYASEQARIYRTHKKDGHRNHPSQCLHPDCLPLRHL